MRMFWVVAMFVAVSCSASELKISPVEVVEKFCGLDFKGARLSSEGYEEISNFVFSIDGEPGWDTIFVTNSYKVVSEQKKDNQSFVTIEYSIWGEASGVGVLAKGSTSNYQFELRKDAYGVWRIENIPPYPRVSKNKVAEITGHSFK